jgi:hypothetical protein
LQHAAIIGGGFANIAGPARLSLVRFRLSHALPSDERWLPHPLFLLPSHSCPITAPQPRT